MKFNKNRSLTLLTMALFFSIIFTACAPNNNSPAVEPGSANSAELSKEASVTNKSSKVNPEAQTVAPAAVDESFVPPVEKKTDSPAVDFLDLINTPSNESTAPIYDKYGNIIDANDDANGNDDDGRQERR